MDKEYIRICQPQGYDLDDTQRAWWNGDLEIVSTEKGVQKPLFSSVDNEERDSRGLTNAVSGEGCLEIQAGSARKRGESVSVWSGAYCRYMVNRLLYSE